MTAEELMEASATEREVLHRLQRNGELSQNQLATLVGGKRVTVIAVANRLVEEGKLSVRPGKRGAKLYDLRRTDPDPQPAPDVREQVATQSTRLGWPNGGLRIVDPPAGQPEPFLADVSGLGLCIRCEARAVDVGLWCDACALLSRKEAGLGG